MTTRIFDQHGDYIEAEGGWVVSTHTPGPWAIEGELLAALYEIIDIKDNGGGLVLGRIEAIARAAIAKAEEGEQS